MRERTAVRNFVWTLLAVLLLPGIALAGAPDGAGSGSDAQLRVATDAACRASLLYTGPSVFLRGYPAGSGDASVREGALAPRPRAPGFWLPDSMETGWLARDKKLHFLACYSIVLTGEAAGSGLDAGVAWAAGLSMAKELWDLWFKTPASHRGVSRGDLAADAAGLVAAVIAVEAFGD